MSFTVKCKFPFFPSKTRALLLLLLQLSSETKGISERESMSLESSFPLSSPPFAIAEKRGREVKGTRKSKRPMIPPKKSLHSIRGQVLNAARVEKLFSWRAAPRLPGTYRIWFCGTNTWEEKRKEKFLPPIFAKAK